jgi:hypothetical protein
MWTLFWDMHSGGGSKEQWENIYIEAPKEEAKIIFYNRFGHNPERVTCTCCGDDYSISEEKTLEQVSGYHRNCRYYGPPRGKDGLWREHNDKGRYFEKGEGVPDGWEASSFGPRGGYISVADYEKTDTVLIIRDKDVEPNERHGSVPEQGYVWHE